jgi:hypothetical protein
MPQQYLSSAERIVDAMLAESPALAQTAGDHNYDDLPARLVAGGRRRARRDPARGGRRAVPGGHRRPAAHRRGRLHGAAGPRRADAVRADRGARARVEPAVPQPRRAAARADRAAVRARRRADWSRWPGGSPPSPTRSATAAGHPRRLPAHPPGDRDRPVLRRHGAGAHRDRPDARDDLACAPRCARPRPRRSTHWTSSAAGSVGNDSHRRRPRPTAGPAPLGGAALAHAGRRPDRGPDPRRRADQPRADHRGHPGHRGGVDGRRAHRRDGAGRAGRRGPPTGRRTRRSSTVRGWRWPRRRRSSTSSS